MPKTLTPQERRVLDYIVAYLQTNTYQPSIREIGREFSIKSTKTVSELLQSLADKGWIERDPSRSRGVRLLGLEMQPDMVSVPVDGVAEGGGAAAYLLDRKLVAVAGAWIMTAEGDHLAEYGVRAGDMLVVEPIDPADVEVGDLVAVTVAGTPSVRRCQSASTSAMVLEPVRAGEVPLTLTRAQAEAVVQGCATTVIRQLRPVLAKPLAVAAHGS